MQSMPDASPTKWHLAHTSWFFETFVLAGRARLSSRSTRRSTTCSTRTTTRSAPRHPRAARGLLSRPSLEEVSRYRQRTSTTAMRDAARAAARRPAARAAARIELGLQPRAAAPGADPHRHQARVRAQPAAGPGIARGRHRRRAGAQVDRRAGAAPGSRGPAACRVGVAIGRARTARFAFDNESPRHQVLLRPFALASRLVTCGEYLAFIADGGYRAPGAVAVRRLGGGARRALGARRSTGSARRPLAPFTLRRRAADRPARAGGHVSYYEADAFARWAGARLPTESEWEVAAAAAP